MGIESLVRRWRDAFQAALKKSPQPRKRTVHRPRVQIEDLEIRCFLSATAGSATMIQPDSNTRVIESSTDLSLGNPDDGIVGLLSNGSLDPAFGTGELEFLPRDLTGDGADVAGAVDLDTLFTNGGLATIDFENPDPPE